MKFIRLNKKSLIILICIILAITIISVYFINKNNKIFNKNFNIGNNITSKSIQEIEQYILNISSYEAKAEVMIESNKNINKYVLKQEYNNSGKIEQIVLEPSNIEGLTISYNEGNLTINNTKLNLQTVYNNYKYVVDNNLWLNSFIKDYRESNNKSISENSDYIVMTVDISDSNNYGKIKILYINKTTGNPEKMLIQDKNQKNMVYILYSEIRINSVSK
ncbi:MAG: hypothetical protein V8R30_00335 [Clostridia bacterium]|jgi:hypothetical protein|nr:hypothetical protein [Clostridia bacterium]CDE82556.1 uncharacterized protein BN581_00666 [Clostridium sp. CAG:273]